MYAHEGGIQAFAGNGPVSLQAHTDQLEILADREVTVISVNDGIEIKASKKIVLQAGQASITLEGRDITFACPGTFSVKGGQQVLDGGAPSAAILPRQPTKLFKLPHPGNNSPGPHQITMLGFDAEGASLKGAAVKFYDAAESKLLGSRHIEATGASLPLVSDAVKDYVALVGYEGWTPYFEQILPESEYEDESFDAGVLEEDRDSEHL